MKVSIKDFSSKYDQIRSFLRIWSHLLEKSQMENFIFCAVLTLASALLYLFIYVGSRAISNLTITARYTV